MLLERIASTTGSHLLFPCFLKSAILEGTLFLLLQSYPRKTYKIKLLPEMGLQFVTTKIGEWVRKYINFEKVY